MVLVTMEYHPPRVQRHQKPVGFCPGFVVESPWAKFPNTNCLSITFHGGGENAAQRLQVVVLGREMPFWHQMGRRVGVSLHCCLGSAVAHLREGICVSGSATWPALTPLRLETNRLVVRLLACFFRSHPTSGTLSIQVFQLQFKANPHINVLPTCLENFSVDTRAPSCLGQSLFIKHTKEVS